MRLAQIAQRISSLETFISHLDVVLGKRLWVSLLKQGLDQMDSEVPSNLYRSVISSVCVVGTASSSGNLL